MTDGRWAVLMGDLVHSERDGVALAMHRHFNVAVERANRTAHPASPLTITLGDEFQGMFATLTAAARTARAMRFELLDHGIECRFAIGIVDLDTDLNTDRAWNMMGRGLADTRARLGEKRAATLYRFALRDEPVAETLLEAVGASLSMIERGWTVTQRRYVVALLTGMSVEEVATAHGVTVHSVYKVRNAGHFDLYGQHWSAIQVALAALDVDHGLTEWE